MAKHYNDPEQEYNDFLNDRQAKLDAAVAKKQSVETYDEYRSCFDKPPARRATDGKLPGTPPENPIVMAAKIDAQLGTDEGEDADGDGIPDGSSTVAQIKAYLDANDISYDGVTKKDDLLALID